jgi:hypothetical protein
VNYPRLARIKAQYDVYFLAVGDEPYIAIKVGVAAQTKAGDLRSSIKRRLDQIQASNHEPIQLLGLVRFTKEEHENPHQFPSWPPPSR